MQFRNANVLDYLNKICNSMQKVYCRTHQKVSNALKLPPQFHELDVYLWFMNSILSIPYLNLGLCHVDLHSLSATAPYEDYYM